MHAAAPPARPSGPSGPPARPDGLPDLRWLQLARLRPVLARCVHIETQRVRGERWHLLRDAEGHSTLRLNPEAWTFVGRCDGQRSLQQLWVLLQRERGAAAPTQAALLELLGELHAQGLLVLEGEAAGSAGAGLTRPVAIGAARRLQRSLLAWQLPLGRPDRWLDGLQPALARLDPGRPGLVAWALLVAAGALAALLHLDELRAFAHTWLGSPRLILLTWIAFPFMKALHEGAHALALKRCGAAVPEWGVTFLVFTPVPYVDASAASTLPLRRQRALVSAAGIGVELALAAAGLLVALAVEPGLVRELGLVLFFIGGVSSLLINGNPLLRYDGYHLLTDALDLPNLATRSRRWWLEHLQRRLLGLEVPRPLLPAPGEGGWLAGYAPAALAWRLALSGVLVLWAGHFAAVLGWAMAAYLVVTLLLQPLQQLLHWLDRPQREASLRRRARRRLGLLAAGALFGAVALPLPDASLVQGVVWTPEPGRVRAGVTGTLAELQVQDGQWLRAGDAIARLDAPELAAQAAGLDGAIEALDTERYLALRSDAARAESLGHELEAALAERERVAERERALSVTAPVAGRVALAHADDLPGRHLRQGALIAEILTDAPTTLRVALPQHLAPRVQLDTRRIEVLLAEAGARPRPARLLGSGSSAGNRLPSAALGDRHGGALVTDPRDAEGLQTAQPVVVLDLQLDGPAPTRTGGRASVRFDHGWSPLALQLARQAQQLVLARFNPA